VRAGAKIEYNLRWPGHYYDPETGLHCDRYRYYDPGLGRYLQSDPLGYGGSTVNLYAYCPNPLVEVDILGLAHSGKKKGNNSEPEHERTERKAKKNEISPVTGTKVKGAHTVVEHSVDGQVVARYYVDKKGRTVRAEGLLNPPAKYHKEGVSHVMPEGFESGRDHRGHLVPERSVPHQDAVNVHENVIAEHGTESNLSKKKQWENQAFDHAQEDPGSWSVHEPQYDGNSMRPSSVDHNLYDSSGNEVPGMNRNIPNPE
jgi:RHS repeat-associated protein